MDNNDTQIQEESVSLDYLLQSKVKEFFEEVWQLSCAIFRMDLDAVTTVTTPPRIVCDDKKDPPPPPPQSSTEHKHHNSNPLRNLVSSGLQVTEHLLDQAFLYGAKDFDFTNHSAAHREPPLIFQNQSILSQEEIQSKYYCSDDGNEDSHHRLLLWAALLDGCSIVINHADLVSPKIACLCEDLQRSVPHAYANVYITPTHQQAVEAHADDRDVFIIQLYGSKQWTVYHNVPIPLPYPNEQVGKDGLMVPNEVLNGPVLIQTTLRPGDVLYLPRGYVHQATSGAGVSSHVTVALATHDWTMAGLLEAAGRHVWRNRFELRAAVPREIGRCPLTPEQHETLSKQVQTAIDLLRNELSVEAIEAAMRQKFERHNSRARSRRTALMNIFTGSPSTVPVGTQIPDTTFPTGPKVAQLVSLDSFLRVSTDEETSLVRKPGVQVGLQVHEDIYEEATRLIGMLKANGGKLRNVATSLCEITRLALAKQCVALGALAIDHEQN